MSVRAARRADVPSAVAGVCELLVELGSTPPPMSAMEAVALELVEDPRVGVLLVAEGDAEDGHAAGGTISAIVGVLGASWQTALHVPGRYALIQDLWVHPSWRSRAIGAALIDALCEHARADGAARLEVGLPRERFAQIQATEAFYLRNGFESLGPRMRRVLS